MRKSSINELMMLNFWWMRMANLLLFTSTYMLFPVLSFVMPKQVGISLPQTGIIFLMFTVAIFAVEPFHTFLCDECKRKNVLLYSTLIMLAATAGYVFADSYMELLLLVSVQGACFGLATTADITVAIGITASTRRSAGNIVYAWSAKLGVLIGAGAGVLLFDFYGFRTVICPAVAAGAFNMFLASKVYVVFRAPIGMRLCDMSRFLLPRVWVPVLNVLLTAFIPEILLPLLYMGDYIALLALVILVCLAMPFIKMLVKPLHHCQRGTASTTCYLAMEMGLLAGLAVACRLADTYPLYHTTGVATVLAIFFFALLTYPYYKRKGVR